MLLLIRHARPLVQPELAPARWPLGPEGEAQALALGAVLRPKIHEPVILASPELKAIATARACFPGEPVTVAEGLAEVSKPWFDSSVDMSVATAKYLGGELLDGWESPEAVIERFDLALTRLDGQEVVAVTHGTAMALWLSRQHRLADPFQWWTQLRLPDAWQVDLTAPAPVRVVD